MTHALHSYTCHPRGPPSCTPALTHATRLHYVYSYTCHTFALLHVTGVGVQEGVHSTLLHHLLMCHTFALLHVHVIDVL